MVWLIITNVVMSSNIFGKGTNVLFLKETYATPVDFQLWKYAACSDGVYRNYGRDGRTCGVSIVIDQHTDHQVHSIKKDENGRYLIMDVSFHQDRIILANFHRYSLVREVIFLMILLTSAVKTLSLGVI